MKKISKILAIFLLVSCSSSQEVIETKSFDNTQVIIQEDDNLLVTQEEIIQEAEPKEVQEVYLVTKDFFNNETERELIREEVITEGQPQIKKVGTKEIKRITTLIIDKELEVIYQEDPTLEFEEEQVIEVGVLGRKRVTTEEVYIKGVLQSSTEVKTDELTKAEPRIISTNTLEPETPPAPPAPPGPPGPIVDVDDYDNTDLSWWYIPDSPKARISNEVANLISEFNVIWQVPTSENIVYLTFDEGYEYGNNTSSILDTLAQKNVLSTFFVTGSYVDNNPALVARMINEGHQVANHTINHYRAAPTIAESRQKYIDDVKDLEPKVPQLVKLHRPPEGGYSQQSLAILDELGYTTVFWSFAYRDWLTDNQPDPNEAFNTIINNLHPGSILLLHAVSDTNTEILGDVIDEIRNQGYQINQLQP